MTEEEFVQQTYLLLEKSTDYPSSDEETYKLIKGLGNVAIPVWEGEEGVLWNELFVSLSDADDGDKETEAEVSDYDCPSDFKFPVGYLRIGSTYYRLIKPANIQLYDNDTSTRFWYVTGNAKVGYTYHIHPAPTVKGDPIQFEYYKSAALLEKADDVIEMSDPQFVVYWDLAELVKEEDAGLAQSYLDIALSKLRAMRVKNIMPAHWQDNQIDDYFQGYNFGE